MSGPLFEIALHVAQAEYRETANVVEPGHARETNFERNRHRIVTYLSVSSQLHPGGCVNTSTSGGHGFG
jgi:hypothetical protein